MKKHTRNFFMFVSISLGVGVVSAFLTSGNMNIYEEISTPPLSPPSFLFPGVWIVLYVLMGISAAIVFNTRTSSFSKRKDALTVYSASLFFNFFWSIIFFNIRAFLFSFVWLVVLFALIIFTIIRYYRINKTAAYLQIPYAVWVTFAGYLNFGIWLLNK